MKKQDLVEWIIDNGRYLFTVRDTRFKINLYQVKNVYWEVYFNISLNQITRAGKVTKYGMHKFLNNIRFKNGK